MHARICADKCFEQTFKNDESLTWAPSSAAAFKSSPSSWRGKDDAPPPTPRTTQDIQGHPVTACIRRRRQSTPTPAPVLSRCVVPAATCRSPAMTSANLLARSRTTDAKIMEAMRAMTCYLPVALARTCRASAIYTYLYDTICKRLRAKLATYKNAWWTRRVLVATAPPRWLSKREPVLVADGAHDGELFHGAQKIERRRFTLCTWRPGTHEPPCPPSRSCVAPVFPRRGR